MNNPALESDEAVRRRPRGVNIPRRERVATATTGAAVLLYGVHRRDAWGWLAAALGAALIARGAVGRCPIYRLRTRPLGAGIDVERSIVIPRPRREVFALLRELRNLPRFLSNITLVEERRDVSHWMAEVGPVQLEWLCELVACVPDLHLRWRSIPGGDVSCEGRFDLEDADGGGTLLTATLRYWPPVVPLSAPLHRFLRTASGHQLATDLIRLRELLERREQVALVRRPAMALLVGARP